MATKDQQAKQTKWQEFIDTYNQNKDELNKLGLTWDYFMTSIKNGIIKTLSQAIKIINDKLHLSNKFNEVSSDILRDYRQINDDFDDEELLKQI